VRLPSAVSTAACTAVLAAAALSAGLVGAPPAGAGPSDPAAPAGPARAATAPVLGHAGGVPAVCTGTPSVPAATLLATEGAGAASYVAPTDGVLTSFTHVAGTSAGQVRAIVLADTTTSGRKLVVAKSPLQTLTPSTTNTFAIALPIKAGQRLALGYTSAQTVCLNRGVTGDSASFAAPFDPDTTSELVATGSFEGGYRPNISAVLEPAPDTVLTKKPKKRTTRTRIKVEFISTLDGSAFECSRDGHKFKPCQSPYKRRFGPGEHKLLVRAVSAAGIVDATPAKVRFTIR
jgi:hypothetical protein